MTQTEKFWKSKEVVEAQNIQRKNPWGSAEDKAAHTAIVAHAKKMNVLQLIEGLEEY